MAWRGGLGAAACIVGLGIGAAQAAPVQWTGAGSNGHWYELVLDTTVGWTAARDAAAVRGGHLVTITGAAEQLFINTLFVGAAVGSYWIGASDAAVEGSFAWVTGEPFSFSNWGAGQPDNNSNANFGGAAGEDYAQLVWRPDYSSALPGGWNDAPEAGYSGRTDFPVLNRLGYLVEYTVHPVPAPGSLPLLAVGLLALGLGARQRRVRPAR